MPRTSTIALNNATLKFGLEIANKGLEKSVEENPSIKEGLNTYKGYITQKDVAESFHKEFITFESLR